MHFIVSLMGGLSRLVLARWAGWFTVNVVHHVKCWSRSNDSPS